MNVKSSLMVGLIWEKVGRKKIEKKENMLYYGWKENERKMKG